MGGLRHFLHRLLNVIRPGRAEASLEREVASHLLLLEDEYRRRGLSASEARRTARLVLGGVERAKELHREARSFAWVDETWRDLQYAGRMLTSNVGFTLAVGVRDVRQMGLDAPVRPEMYVPIFSSMRSRGSRREISSSEPPTIHTAGARDHS